MYHQTLRRVPMNMKKRSFHDDAHRALLELRDCKTYLLRLLDVVDRLPESSEKGALAETLERARCSMIRSAEDIVMAARAFNGMME
jgi:hypothetical protein